MKDRDFLIWLHEQLINVYGADESFDYMHKLRAVISTTDKDKYTPNTSPFNTIEQMEKEK